MERQKVGGKKQRFLYSRTRRTRCFNQSYHFEKILTREYLPKSEAPVLFPSISMWGGFGVCFFLFFFQLICFYFQTLFLFALFLFVLSQGYLFNFLSPFAALRMQADLFSATKLLHAPSRVSFHTEQNSSCQDARLRQNVFLKFIFMLTMPL